jgi:hypothetical protein
MPRDFFTVNRQDGSVEAMVFHDQIAVVENRDGHAYIIMCSGYHIELRNITVDTIFNSMKPR